MKQASLLVILISTLCRAQTGPIDVYLKSGKVISTRYVYISQGGGFSGPFVRVQPNSKDKIKIDDVDHIEGVDQTGKHRYVRPVDWRLSTIWAERTYQSDRISLYYVGIVQWGLGVSTTKWKYFQYTKDDGPLTKLSIRNVSRDVGDNPESASFIRKSKTNRILQALLYTTGGVLVITSAVKDLNSVDKPDSTPDPAKDDFKLPVGFIAGAACIALPLALKPGKQKNLVNALEVYK